MDKETKSAALALATELHLTGGGEAKGVAQALMVALHQPNAEKRVAMYMDGGHRHLAAYYANKGGQYDET